MTSSPTITRASRSPSLPLLVGSVGAVAVLALGPAAAAAGAPGGAEPGTTKGGQVVQDGWWSRSNEPAPETGVLQPPSVPAAAAPAGTLPVASVNGEPERIAAIELGLRGEPDSVVTSLVLALRESDAPGANLSSQLATLQACPVTEAFFVGVDNGAWPTRPAFDCDVASAPGARDEEGVWTFDLTALASSWLSSSYGFSSAVVIVGAPPVDPSSESSSFQVGFDAEKGIGFAAVTEAPAESDDDEPETGEEDGSGAAGGATGGGSGLGGLPSTDTGGALDGGSTLPPPGDLPALGSVPVEPGTSATAPPGESAGAQPISTAVAPLAATRGPWYAGLGAGPLLLLAIAALLAYLMMIALGPQGRPVVGSGAGRRGVSRALERRRAALVQLTRRTR